MSAQPAPEPTRIRPRERDTLLQALRAGVVPWSGHQHIQVGRVAEVKALVADLASVRDGGAAVRFVIGEFGSGKTFFLHLVRSVALQQRLVTAHADLSPDRRLQATGGQARGLYTELMRNLATRARPDGGAMPAVVERFVTAALAQARETGAEPDAVIRARLAELSELTGGYDFAEVVAAYWRGHDTDDEQLRVDAVRWLRGEFATRTDARRALGVRTIVDDGNVHDHIKLLARFVRLAGYDGLVVCLDEMVNLYKLANTRARNANYEQLLRIVNDTLQGTGGGLGFVFSGTPDFLLDTRRGLYSYPALQSRLSENAFAVDGLLDHSGPVLRLANLTPEDLYVLLGKLRNVYAGGDPAAHLVPDEALEEYMRHCASRIGDAYFRTPRNTIKGFLDLLAVLDQNPDRDWQDLIGSVSLATEPDPELAPIDDAAAPDPTGPEREPPEPEPPDEPPDDDELASFRL